MSLYSFLTGPMLWITFAIFILGVIYRGVMYVRGLDWQLDRVPYGYYTSYAVKGALKSIFHWLVPFGSRSWQVKPIFATLFFVFHIGLVVVPLFLYAHGLILFERFGISWPALPAALADTLTIAMILAGVGILLRRFALPEVRFITTFHDIAIMAITLAPFITGFVASRTTGESYSTWLLAHIITGEVMLIAIPFTKLSHFILFFMSRAQLGMDYGVKRGGMKGRGIAW